MHSKRASKVLRSCLSVSILLAACARVGTPGSNGHPPTLSFLAAKARSAGQTQVNLGTVIGQCPDVRSLEDALHTYSVMVLKPLSSEAVVENGRDVLTWYQSQIIARLSLAPASPLSPPLSRLPPDIIPRGVPADSNEILLLHNGGTVTVDGVVFTSSVAGFPQLSILKEYLCLLSTSDDGAVAIVPLGGSGVFEIANHDTLHALGNRAHPVPEGIERSYANSLARLSGHLRRGDLTAGTASNTPPPPLH